MLKRSNIGVLTVILALGLLLSGCGLLGPAAPTTNPTDQQATVNAAVVQTLQANAVNETSTAAGQPTATNTTLPTETVAPLPTDTPQPTATIYIPPPTATYVPATPKPTLTVTPSAYTCQLISTSPAVGKKINVNTNYDASWVVKNVGTKDWEISYLDYKYESGTKMQTGADIFDVMTAVAVDDELKIIVDMKTPATAGKYTANWVLTMDGKVMCNLPVSIEAVVP